MKKVLMLVVIIGLAAFTAYKLLSKKEEKPTEKTEGPLTISKNSEAFNTSFAKIMTSYYALKDAFVEWDSVQVDQLAQSLKQTTDSLLINELKADSSVIQTAQSYVKTIDGEVDGLVSEKTIEQKRRAFNMLSNDIYDLVRVVKYDREVLYHIKCPMAFNDSEEAYWLSNTNKVVNPYLGKKHPTYKDKMLGCGEVTDSLNFAKK
ncbi:MAG: DUF3347 domain-containing protein [Bacteroidetes bacterium]|nr:DUF3347 domain-containing protein [Bacteroidota bacterium]